MKNCQILYIVTTLDKANFTQIQGRREKKYEKIKIYNFYSRPTNKSVSIIINLSYYMTL